MEIKVNITNRNGEIENITYHDVDSDADLAGKKIEGCRAYSFHGDKFILVYAASKGYWTPPGGGVEEGETVPEAVAREIKEETNMKVLSQRLIGYSEVLRSGMPHYYSVSVCLVEPNGEFISDPDGDITEIKLIDFKDYKNFSDHRITPIVERQMERAKVIKVEMEKEVVLM